MSERGFIEVVVPVFSWPSDRREMQEVLRAGFQSARQLLASAGGGHIEGVDKITRGVTADGSQEAVKLRIAVLTREQNFERERVWAGG